MNNQKKTEELEKIKKFLVDEKRKIIRGEKGKFVSLKKIELEKSLPNAQPIELTFFGKKVRKFYVGDWVFFAVDDIIATANPLPNKDQIEYAEDYEQIRTQITRKIGDVDVADAAGILKIIRQIQAVFPGPLARWLNENSTQPPPPTPPKTEENKNSTSPINPSDRG